MNKNNEKLVVTFTDYSNELTSIIGSKSCLNDGASKEDIGFLTEALDIESDSQIIDLYSIANGQVESDQCLPYLIDGYYLLSINRAIEEYRMLLEVASNEPDIPEWHKMHLPFASDYAGNYLVIDLTTTKEVNDFTVFGYEVEDDNRALGKSLSEFFKSQTLILRNGNYYLEDNMLFAK
ncbi:SMI1/KNR4 family protein [Alteromonas sp. PRIM-21]|uniref:SMI1/KNR4 family protein n=1 Tax=Alteromonas sp. PRIM-21 TaxID=1454978 RepID=UPI0022B974CD|nr:SMI1/KNR4 family protein [Alteromonas sp. PRIM-21]MCZ8530398.1 SMI1/KNR4 family protein [Alteromonas sp. PRIM-21]